MSAEESANESRASVHVLRNARGQQLYLLGTAHVSEKSAIEAQSLIREVCPSIVFLELCEKRKSILESSDETTKEDTASTSRVGRTGDMLVSIAESFLDILYGRTNAVKSLLSQLLAKAADNQGVVSGNEFLISNIEAQKISATVILGDRDVDVTLSRLFFGLSLWQRTLFTATLAMEMFIPVDKAHFKKSVETMRTDEAALTEQTSSFGEKFPWMNEVMLHERDLYMTLGMNQAFENHPSDSCAMVAVVGAAHIPGIKRNWQRNISPEDGKRMRSFLEMTPATQSPVISASELRTYAKSFEALHFGPAGEVSQEWREKFIKNVALRSNMSFLPLVSNALTIVRRILR